NEFGDIGPDEPIDLRIRITGSKLHEHGHGVNHVAQRGGLNQQNAIELLGSQSLRVQTAISVGVLGCGGASSELAQVLRGWPPRPHGSLSGFGLSGEE